MRLLLNKTSFKPHIQIYPTTETTLTAKVACTQLHTHTRSPPKWVGPVPDSHFDGIISLITHDAKGCINVQKTSQSFNHQTDTATHYHILCTMHQQQETDQHTCFTRNTEKNHFCISQQRSMLATSYKTKSALSLTSKQTLTAWEKQQLD